MKSILETVLLLIYVSIKIPLAPGTWPFAHITALWLLLLLSHFPIPLVISDSFQESGFGQGWALAWHLSGSSRWWEPPLLWQPELLAWWQFTGALAPPTSTFSGLVTQSKCVRCNTSVKNTKIVERRKIEKKDKKFLAFPPCSWAVLRHSGCNMFSLGISLYNPVGQVFLWSYRRKDNAVSLNVFLHLCCSGIVHLIGY